MTLKEKYYKKLDWNVSGTHQRKLEVSGDCVSIADDYAIEFAEWKEKNNYWHSKDNKCFFKFKDKQTKYTIKELLEIFKKEKNN